MVDFTQENMGHLILTRKPGQSIRIDGPAVVEVIEMPGGRVKIGIRADRNVRVLRGELDERPPRAA